MGVRPATTALWNPREAEVSPIKSFKSMSESKPLTNSSFPESTDASAGPFRLEDFEYDLPPELIAQEPLAARDQSRLMLFDRKSGSFSLRIFSGFPAFLPPGNLL